jgi:hypothetical protein
MVKKMILKPFKTRSNQVLGPFKTRPEYGRVFALIQLLPSVPLFERPRIVFKALEKPDG